MKNDSVSGDATQIYREFPTLQYKVVGPPLAPQPPVSRLPSPISCLPSSELSSEHASYFLSTCYTLPCHAISPTHHSTVFSECRKTGHKETWRLEAERPEEHETEECQGDGTQRDGRSKTGTQGEQVGKKADREPNPQLLECRKFPTFFRCVIRRLFL